MAAVLFLLILAFVIASQSAYFTFSSCFSFHSQIVKIIGFKNTFGFVTIYLHTGMPQRVKIEKLISSVADLSLVNMR